MAINHVADFAEQTERVASSLRDRVGMAALGAQGLPALERFGAARLDLDHHLRAVIDRLVPAEQELLDGGHRASIRWQEAGRVGMAGHGQPWTGLDRDQLWVVAVGGHDRPAGALQRAHDNRFERVARLQHDLRFRRGRIGHGLLRRRVPKGAAAAAERRGADFEPPVVVEPSGGAVVDIRPGVGCCGHFGSSLLSCNESAGAASVGSRRPRSVGLLRRRP